MNLTGPEELHQMAEESVEEALSAEHIDSYLAVAAGAPAYYWENQLLIWQQCKAARDVAGIRRWRDEGRRLKKDASPICVLWPEIKRGRDGISIREGMVEVYDISQVTGDVATIKRDLSELEYLIRRHGIVYRRVEPASLPAMFPEGYVKGDEFFLPKGIEHDRDRFERAQLKHLVAWSVLDMRGDNREIVESRLQETVEALCGHLTGLYFTGSTQRSRASLIAAGMKGFTHDEKKLVLSRTSLYFLRIVEAVKSPMLDFYQTAVMNGLITPGTGAELTGLIQQVQKKARDPVLVRSCEHLYRKLMGARDGVLEELIRKKTAQGVLYSSPPTLLPSEVTELFPDGTGKEEE